MREDTRRVTETPLDERITARACLLLLKHNRGTDRWTCPACGEAVAGRGRVPIPPPGTPRTVPPCAGPPPTACPDQGDWTGTNRRRSVILCVTRIARSAAAP